MKTKRLFLFVLAFIVLGIGGPAFGQERLYSDDVSENGMVGDYPGDSAPAIYTDARQPPVLRYRDCSVLEQGDALSGSFHLEVSVFDSPKGGRKIWGPEEHPFVDVDNGCFEILLGLNIAFPPGDYNDPLYLKLFVDGAPLENRIEVEMKEAEPRSADKGLKRNDARPVTHVFESKALTVYGTAIINDSTENSRGLYVRGKGYGMYVEENGVGDVGLYSPDFIVSDGYRSSEDSYMWFPGILAVRGDITTSDISYTNDGSVVISKTGSTGNANIFLPIALPGMLFGQNVKIEEFRVYYKCSSPNSYITSTYLNKQTSASDHVNLVNDFTDHTSEIDASYSLSPDPEELDINQGILILNVYMSFTNIMNTITIGGVRVRLGHI